MGQKLTKPATNQTAEKTRKADGDEIQEKIEIQTDDLPSDVSEVLKVSYIEKGTKKAKDFIYAQLNREPDPIASHNSDTEKTSIVSEKIEIQTDDLPSDVSEVIKASYIEKGTKKAKDFIYAQLNRWKTTEINIACIGQSGAGKSSWINTMRGIKPSHRRAAKVSIAAEGTRKPTPYQHPQNKMLVFWDLPGANTPNFPLDAYMDEINCEKFDIFMIFTATRFFYTDYYIAEKVKSMEKQFLFVRTKVDADIYSDAQIREKSRDEDKILAEIRKQLMQTLDEHKMTAPVYLVNNYCPELYDMPKLAVDIVKFAPESKKEALTFTLPPFGREMIEEKVRYLKSRVWKLSLASAGTGLSPIPGTSFAADMVIMISEVRLYMEQLRLGNEAVSGMAKEYDIPIENLQAIGKWGTMSKDLDVKSMIKLITELIGVGFICLGLHAVEESLKSIWGVGTITGPILGLFTSGIGTFCCLYGILTVAEKAAIALLELTAHN